ncbi:MAG: hypothetical protein KBG40_02915 [Bacteroidales bacterium]|nr:hypothetical protein [Bacteroidales bacterium]
MDRERRRTGADFTADIEIGENGKFLDKFNRSTFIDLIPTEYIYDLGYKKVQK